MNNPSDRSAESCSKPPLVLITGWGHRTPVWQDLAALADSCFDVHLVELPGYDGSAQPGDTQAATAQVVEELALAVPLNSIVCGWSLGGMLATRLAARYPERVSALVTLCSNPVFVARDDWRAAMPAVTYDEFSRQLADAPVATLNRFQGLAAAGSSTAKQDLRRLRELHPTGKAPGEMALIASLEMLAGLDVRADIKAVTQPQLHILGREDALVPAAAASAIALLNPAARVDVLPEVSHLPMISSPELVLERLQDVLNYGAKGYVASTG